MNTMNALVAVRVEGDHATELWRNTQFPADAASPLLYQDVLFLLKNGGLLSSVRPDTGELIRQERALNFEGPVFASPVAGDGKQFLANAAGKVAVIAAAAQWSLLQGNDLEDPIYAAPALNEGGIIVRTEQYVWSFRLNSASPVKRPAP